MNKRPLYIFDLDGTLALIDHRRHYLDDLDDSDRWKKFYEACDGDEPNWPVIGVMQSLYESGADIWIFSGRCSSVREKTTTWLEINIYLNRLIILGRPLTMRNEGDYTPDHILKKFWLGRMSIEDRNRLVAVFDDRDKVVKMWRDNGITCFQVAEGDF